MKVKITTAVVGPDTSIRSGTVVDWPKAQAEEWIKAGKAVPVTKGETVTVKHEKLGDRMKQIGDSSWYEVRTADGIQKVNGRKNAEALLNG